MDLPTVDDLHALCQFWDGDKDKAPNGQSYWKFMIFKHSDKHTYVLENHWVAREEGGWSMEQIVKRLW